MADPDQYHTPTPSATSTDRPLYQPGLSGTKYGVDGKPLDPFPLLNKQSPTAKPGPAAEPSATPSASGSPKESDVADSGETTITLPAGNRTFDIKLPAAKETEPEAPEPKAPTKADMYGADGDRINAGYVLQPGESISAGEDDKYELSRNKDGDYILTADGKEVWGYSGAGNPLESMAFDRKLGADGSIKTIDNDHEIVKTLIPSGLKPHWELILLYHPDHQSEVLKFYIDTAQYALQMMVDLLGSGKPGLAPDMSKWLHDKGLPDHVDTSETTTKYNEKVQHIKSMKDDLKELDEQVNISTEKVADRTVKLRDMIMTSRDEINEQLHELDNHVQRKISPTPKNVNADIRTYYIIDPSFEDRAEKAMSEKVDKVEKELHDTKAANDDAGHKTPKPKDGGDQEKGDDSKGSGGGKRGPGGGGNAGNGGGGGGGYTPPGTTTETPETGTADQIDFSDIWGDLGDGAASDLEGANDPLDDLTLDELTGTDGGTDGSELDDGSALDSDSAADADDPGTDLDAYIRNKADEIAAAVTGNDAAVTAEPAVASTGNTAQTTNPAAAFTNPYGSGMFPYTNGNPYTGGGMSGLSGMGYDLPSQMAGQGSGRGLGPTAGLSIPGTSAAPGAAVSADPQLLTGDSSGLASAAQSAASGADALVPAPVQGLGTLQVPPTVAQALNHALNDPNGSDAIAAYSGTAGQETPQSPWKDISSNDANTGDVVQFQHRSALVARVDGSLYAIVGGEPVPLDLASPPDDSFGRFLTFKHPSGLDATTAAAQQVAASATPTLAGPKGTRSQLPPVTSAAV